MKFKKTAVFLVVCTTVVVVELFHSESKEEKLRNRANAEEEDIAVAVDLYAATFGSQKALEDFHSCGGAVLYSNLANSSIEKQVVKTLPNNPVWDKALSVIDPWGGDYQCEASQKTNSSGKAYVEIRMLSDGPNRTPEGGHGDDVEFIHKIEALVVK